MARGLAVAGGIAVLAVVAWLLMRPGDPSATPESAPPSTSPTPRTTDSPSAAAPSGSPSPAPTTAPTADPIADDDELVLDASTGPGEPPAATSRDLIAAAVAAGELDDTTALQYRVYAQFGDPRLPDAYTGARRGHDPGAMATAVARLDSLPEDVRTAIAPYLRRPTDPTSAFAEATAAGPEGTGGPAGMGGVRVRPVAAPGPGLPVAAAADRRPCGSWVSTTMGDLPFRVWACETHDVDGDLDAIFDPFHTLLGPVEEMLRPAPDGMGPPDPDQPDTSRHPDEDDRIDIYVLDNGWVAPDREDERESVQSDESGVTIPVPPFLGQGSSGYVLVDRALVDDPADLARTIVHEVFHVQQLAHNFDVYTDHAWLTEGSATWAETHWVRSDSRQVHDSYLSGMQLSPRSVVANRPDDHPYQAYLWPLFMEQQAGVASVVGTWQAFDSLDAPDLDQVLDVLAGFVPLEASLPEFALRLLNAAPAGDPIPTRFVHVDPNFPDDQLPPLGRIDRGHRLTGDEPVEIAYATWDGPTSSEAPPLPEGLPPMSYRFDHVTVPGASNPDDPRSVEVTIDDTLQAHAGTAVLQAVVRGPEGQYRREHIDLREGAEFCGAEVLLFVLTNSSRDEVVDGTVTVDAGDDPVCALAGDVFVDLDGEYTGAPDEIPFTETASVHLQGVLDVAVGPPQEDPYAVDPEDTSIHPDTGSAWTLHGSYRHERCAPFGSRACTFWTEQTFRYHGEVSAGGGDLELEVEDSGIRLRADLPVTITTTVKDRVDRPPRTETSEQVWPITCVTPGNWWAQGPDYVFGLASGDDAVGEWVDEEQTTIAFDCQRDGSPTAYQDAGEISSVSLSIQGEVTMDLPE